MPRLHSLLLVEKKLLEVEYFVDRLPLLFFEGFAYELNAFLSTARSVTFLLQKEMRDVPDFNSWWSDRVAEMKGDPAMVFFRESRNFSQKEGRVSIAGTGGLLVSGGEFMSYRFQQHGISVPKQLVDHDVVECCREHLGKLASIVLAYADAFPLHSCPRRAVTVEGLKELGLELSDIEKMLGYPRDWTDVPDVPRKERVRVLQGQFDGVDFRRIGAIARYDPNRRPLEQ